MSLQKKNIIALAILLSTTMLLSSTQMNAKEKTSASKSATNVESKSQSKTEAKAETKGDTKAESSERSDFYYFADRNSFPADAKYFDYDSRPWKEEEKFHIAQLLSEIKKEAPGVVALASVHGPIPLLRSPRIPYRSIMGNNTNAYVLAVDSALFIADGAEQEKDLKRILLHEIVHMADLGRHVAYSQSWVSFAKPYLQNARRQVSCQFLLDAKTSEFTQPKWPSTESCTSYKESLCEFASKYILDSKFKKEFKDAQTALAPILHPSDKDLDFARHYMQGRIYFRSEKPDDALREFEAAAHLDESAPAPHVFNAQCWYEKKVFDKACGELHKAKDLFEKANVGMTESLHWRTLSMLANSFALLNKYDEAKLLLDRLALSRVQYDPSLFQRRSLCNEKVDNLKQSLLDFYDYQFLTAHERDASHYFDFIEDREFLQSFLSKKFPTPDGRRSHVFSICWERLAIGCDDSNKNKFIESARQEVSNASKIGYYSKDEELIRKHVLSYLNGENPNDFERIKESDADKKLVRELEVIKYLSGKPMPAKGSDEFAAILRQARPTDSQNTKWLF